MDELDGDYYFHYPLILYDRLSKNVPMIQSYVLHLMALTQRFGIISLKIMLSLFSVAFELNGVCIDVLGYEFIASSLRLVPFNYTETNFRVTNPTTMWGEWSRPWYS